MHIDECMLENLVPLILMVLQWRERKVGEDAIIETEIRKIGHSPGSPGYISVKFWSKRLGNRVQFLGKS
jgi:hypothetical protein